MAITPATRVWVFDLDDTLYDERDYVASGLAAVGRWAADRLGYAGFAACAARLFAAGVRGTLFDDALAELGFDPDPATIRRMIAIYRRHRPAIVLAPDARRLLAALPRGTRAALITDGHLAAQRRKVAALDLRSRGVAPRICTDRWGRKHWKPSPLAFRHVQQCFDLPASAFTYIADNPSKDFVAPRQLGWRTVQVCRPDRLHHAASAVDGDPDRMIATLDELV